MSPEENAKGLRHHPLLFGALIAVCLSGGIESCQAPESDLDAVLGTIAGQRDTVIELQTMLVGHPALSPIYGGEGEMAKCQAILDWLAALGVTDVQAMHAPDDRVPAGVRPNVAIRMPGVDTTRTLWIVAHMDVVPPGDPEAWDSDPFTLRVEGDAMYGRGVEDDNQGIVVALQVAQALVENSVTPPVNFGMLFLAAEETDWDYGPNYVMAQHPEIFGPKDCFLVPDYGNDTGTIIEVAEKSKVWLRFTILGQQGHSALPHLGNNALVPAADLILRIRGLYDTFPATDPIFAPPYSSFESTQLENSANTINTMPGRIVFTADCRLLPDLPPEEVLAVLDDAVTEVAQHYGVEASYEIISLEAAPPATAADSAIVTRLQAALHELRGFEAELEGVGGQTIATVFRAAGYPAAVWMTQNATEHQPNERGSVAHCIHDAEAIAHVLLSPWTP